jgi:proline dehydrogenase
MRQVGPTIKFPPQKWAEPSQQKSVSQDMISAARALAHKSTERLAAEACLFSALSVPSLATLAHSMLTIASTADQGSNWLAEPLSAPVLEAARRTVFKLFCAGETLEDLIPVAQTLQGCGVRMIVDHSTEEKESADAWSANLNAKTNLLEYLAGDALGGSVKFMPVKVTALASPAMLEDLTAFIRQRPDWATQAIDLSSMQDPALDCALNNLRALCDTAKRVGIPVLFDAEQSYRQPAIDCLALKLMSEFNSGPGSSVVFNTYQMYLHHSMSRVQRDLDVASCGGFTLAVKLVRGAYLQQEILRCASLGLPSEAHASKAATDEAYDQAAELLLSSLTSDDNAAAVMLATHNTESVLRATSLLGRLELPRAHHGVHFAQIMGMNDRLTASLGIGGYNSHKLVLYGDFAEVFPWLLRRLEENQDMYSAMASERHVLSGELESRLGLK